MQENGTMNWLEQIHQMKNRDIRTIEQSELEKLPQDAVGHGLPQEERLKNLLDGYQKDPSNHTKLIVDELAAETVQDIFRWKISGIPLLQSGKSHFCRVIPAMENLP